MTKTEENYEKLRDDIVDLKSDLEETREQVMGMGTKAALDEAIDGLSEMLQRDDERRKQ